MTMIGVRGRMFLLVPVHSGCLRRSPESRKIVVIVVAVVVTLNKVRNIILVTRSSVVGAAYVLLVNTMTED